MCVHTTPKKVPLLTFSQGRFARSQGPQESAEVGLSECPAVFYASGLCGAVIPAHRGPKERYSWAFKERHHSRLTSSHDAPKACCPMNPSCRRIVVGRGHRSTVHRVVPVFAQPSRQRKCKVRLIIVRLHSICLDKVVTI